MAAMVYTRPADDRHEICVIGQVRVLAERALVRPCPERLSLRAAVGVMALFATPSLCAQEQRDGAEAVPSVAAAGEEKASAETPVEAEERQGADRAAGNVETPMGMAPPLTPATPPSLPPDPSSLPDVAPVSESEFSLDIDEQLDVGVAWPDMTNDAPDVRLSGPLHGDSAPETENAPSPAEAENAPDVDMAEGISAGADENAEGTQAGAPDQPGAETVPGERPPHEGPVLADDGSERRYEVVLSGLEEIADAQFNERFNSLSTLKAESGHPANLAQINRRMELDQELLNRILRAKGYYGAFIARRVRPPEEGGNGKLRAQFAVRPGTLYTLSSVSLPGLAHAVHYVPKLATIFPVKVGDPVDADKITAGRVDLAKALGENGFPFSRVDEPQVTVDHDTQKGALEIVVRAGGYRRFGDIVLDERTGELFSARHLERIARFDREDVYQASEVEDLRRAIVATGLVSSVSVTPKDAGDGEHADISVAAIPAPMRTIAGEIGYGTGEGYRLEGSWQHRNFFPPEGAVTVRGLIGTKEQAAGLSYRRNNFRRRDNVLTGAFTFYHRDYDAYKAKTLALTAGLERQTNLLFQKKWVWSVGAQLLGTRERSYYGGSSIKSSRNYLIGALPVSLTYDGSDDLLDPTRGFRIGARVSPEASWQGKAFTYVTTQIDGSAYMPVSEKVVLASRVRLGSILGGVDVDRIAPSRRFYAGGGASVRGYGYQAIGPRDPENDPYGGKSLAEFSVEARIRFGTFGVVPFVDAGNISTGFLPKLEDVRYGAGIGLRYYSTFGPIRIDVGTPLNPQKGDSRIAVYVSLGQAF